MDDSSEGGLQARAGIWTWLEDEFQLLGRWQVTIAIINKNGTIFVFVFFLHIGDAPGADRESSLPSSPLGLGSSHTLLLLISSAGIVSVIIGRRVSSAFRMTWKMSLTETKSILSPHPNVNNWKGGMTNSDTFVEGQTKSHTAY